MGFILNRYSVLALFLFFLLSSFYVNAQSPDYQYGNNLGSNIAPLKSNISNKTQWLYKVDEFNTAPPSQGLITKVYLKRSTGSSSNNTYQNFKIRIAQVADTMIVFPNDIF